jgi:O-antigen ligase
MILLLLSGLVILYSRSVSLASTLAKNWALCLFFLYALVSLSWSTVQFAAFSSWVRMIGQFVMVLVILSEKEPEEAFRTVLKRIGYVLIPLSVVFIKWVPSLGRQYSVWGGAQDVGAAAGKMQLAALSVVIGLFCVATLLSARRRPISKLDRNIALLILAMCGWLVVTSHASTYYIASIVGVAVILSLRVSVVRENFTTLVVLGAVVLVVLLATTSFQATVIAALGKDQTLTGRTDLWEDLRAFRINPLLGAGFESFWTADKRASLREKHWWAPTQAHNGYYELYLNLGLLGSFFQFLVIISYYFRLRKRAAAGEEGASSGWKELADFGLAFIFAFVISLWTEGSWKPGTFTFFVFMGITGAYGSTLTNTLKSTTGIALAGRRGVSRRNAPPLVRST